ncbi:beta carbonic anhydrase 5, chloroplastic isoform X2 [Tanacetum coccineum]
MTTLPHQYTGMYVTLELSSTTHIYGIVVESSSGGGSNDHLYTLVDSMADGGKTAVNSEETMASKDQCYCGGIRALKSMDDEDNSSFIKNWVVVGKAARSSTKATTSNLSFDQQCKHYEKESRNNSLLDLLYAFVSEDDEETGACKSLFQNKTFFLGREVPWSNERPLEKKELNAIIGAWFTLWRDYT